MQLRQEIFEFALTLALDPREYLIEFGLGCAIESLAIPPTFTCNEKTL